MASQPTRLRLKAHEVATCPTLKVCYDTYLEAQLAAERAMARGDVRPGCHVFPYDEPCPECRRYHIGNRRIVFRDVPPPTEAAT